MRSSERIRRNVGHAASGVLGCVLLWLAWGSWQDDNWRATAFIGMVFLALLWNALVSRYEPDWRSQAPPPSSRVRTIVACALWLGVGGLAAMPEGLMPSGVPAGDPGSPWLRIGVLAFFASPALALGHLQFASGCSEVRKAEVRWGLERLGPIGACAYFLGGEW